MKLTEDALPEALFQPIQLGAIAAKNRVLMAPLTRGRSDPGMIPNAMMAEYYRQRSDAGLIISEATGITVEGYDVHNGRITGVLTSDGTIKAEAVYPRPFWRDAGLSGQCIGDAPVAATFDNSPPDGGIGVLMGAPNLVRGGSHSGNVAAETLARARQAGRSMMSVPVAATAMSLSRGACASVSALSFTLLTMTMSASAMRAAAWSAVVRWCCSHAWANVGARSVVSGEMVSRSKKTMFMMVFGFYSTMCIKLQASGALGPPRHRE